LSAARSERLAIAGAHEIIKMEAGAARAEPSV